MSGCRSEAGRLFQILGPATEKLLCQVFVLGTVRTLAWAESSGVRDQLAVVDQVRWSLTSQWLVDESGQFVLDPQFHRKPVQATKNWWDVVASASSSQNARRRILYRLQTLKQTVTDTVEQRITVIQTAGYERLTSVLAYYSGSARATERNWRSW